MDSEKLIFNIQNQYSFTETGRVHICNSPWPEHGLLHPDWTLICQKYAPFFCGESAPTYDYQWAWHVHQTSSKLRCHSWWLPLSSFEHTSMISCGSQRASWMIISQSWDKCSSGSDTQLKVNAVKSSFCATETEYLGYFLSKEGIKSHPKKVKAILALTTPQNVKQLCRFLGMVQYYRDFWARQSKVLSPFTNLVGECGLTKATWATKTKHKPSHWDDVHQTTFDNIKIEIAKDFVLAYSDYLQGFEIYTDSSKFQLGAVITQNNRPMAFFSSKLNTVQTWLNKNKLQ